MEDIKLNEKLCSAVESQSSVDIRILLEQGADALAFTSSGMSAIGMAASKGNASILTRLLEHTSNSGQEQQQQGTSRLILHGDDWMEFEESTPEGMGDLEWDEEIDSEKGFSPDKEWLDLYSYYARMWENIGQVLDTASDLRDVHGLDRHQMAPLHYAAKFGHLNCVRVLINDYKCPVDIQTHTGQTALHLACEYQHKKIVKYLLQFGANVNLKTFKVEDTALLKAAKNGNNRIIQILLEHGGNINTCNAYDVSALIGATFFGHRDTVKLLLERGANVNFKDRDGLTALVIAVHNEATEMVRDLLQNGARVIPTHNLVHTAINLGNNEILRMLILAGENVIRGRDSYGLTPIDKILQKGNLEMMFFCYDYFRLDLPQPGWDASREVLMALHCDDAERFRQMLNFFLNIGRNICENDVFVTAIQMRKFEHLKILIRENVPVNSAFNEEVIEMMLRGNSEDSLDILMHLVSAGFKVHQISSLKAKLGAGPAERFLHASYTNPLSLQQLTRIQIRSTLKDATKRRDLQDDLSQTPLERAVWRCGLPPQLVRYVYRLPDDLAGQRRLSS